MRRVSSEAAEADRTAVSTEYGDYEGLAVAHGVAHPVWTDSRKASARQEEIYTTALPERLFGR